MGQRGENVADLVPPAALLTDLGEDLAQRLPEPQGPVADSEHRCPHAAALAVAEQVGPRLGRLAEPVGQGDELLGAVGADPDDHQQAHLVLLETDLEVDAVDPAVDVVGAGQRAPVERGGVVLPLGGEPGDGGRRQTGRRAEELFQRREEVPAGQAVQPAAAFLAREGRRSLALHRGRPCQDRRDPEPSPTPDSGPRDTSRPTQRATQPSSVTKVASTP